MKDRPWTIRLLVLITTLFTLAPGLGALAQEEPITKKAVNRAIKKVDRQILSYKPQKARNLLEPVLEAKDPRVNAAMGQILMLEQDYDEAASKLLSASKKSDDASILVTLGDCYAYAKNKGKATSSYRKAAEKAEATLSADPKDARARFALGVADQRLKNYSEAVTNLTRAQSEDPSNERIAFELGLTKMLQGDNQAGFDHLSRAIELNSGYAYAYYYRALAADKIGRKDITVNDLDRFLRLAPKAPEAPKAERILQAARG